jgi:2-polyprenyl-3-methyl-5-hydroxy-6-metoxy-1,4-benzoquinol methylase
MKYGQSDIGHKRRSHNIFKDILRVYAKSDLPKILDVGCAFGVIGALRESPKNVYGIERDSELLRLAEKNCQKVYAMDLEDFDPKSFPESEFDFIFCGDIIEHVLDPLGLLKGLARLLSKEGYVVISVPNIAQFPFRLQLLLGNFNYEETGVLDKTHMHLYTHATAKALIKEAGLEIIKFFPSGTIVSYIPLFPRFFASQLIFLCSKKEF